MNYKSDCVTFKKVKDGAAFYSVRWSEHQRVNRYRITRSVPARPGIFKLYFKDDAGKYRLFYMERVWYGGLRSEIRRASDPLEVADPLRRKVLNKFNCYYSYTIVESKADMFDIMHAYSEFLLPERTPPGASGRYEKIFIDAEPVLSGPY